MTAKNVKVRNKKGEAENTIERGTGRSEVCVKYVTVETYNFLMYVSVTPYIYFATAT